MTPADRPPVLFRRIDETPNGLTAYLVGPPQAAAVWQPTKTMAEAAGRLHEVACERGRWVDVSGLRTDGTLPERRKNIGSALRRVRVEVGEAAPQLGTVLATLETREEDGRIVARVFDRTTGFRIEA